MFKEFLISLLSAQVEISDYDVSESQEFIKKLTEKGADFSQKEFDTDINEGKFKKAFALIADSLNKENLETALQNCLVLLSTQKKSQDTIDIRNLAHKLAVYLYKNSKNRELALFALSTIIDHTHYYNTIVLHEFSKIISFDEFRKKYPKLKNINLFEIKDKEIIRNGRKPYIEIKFSHSLDKEIIAKDFLEITPKIDGHFSIHDNIIKILGFQYGENYTIQLKKGIPSRFGEKTKEQYDLNVMLDDRESFLGFPTNKANKCILHKDEELNLPLTAVNVSKVQVSLYHVNPRVVSKNLKWGALDSSDISSSHLEEEDGELIARKFMDIKGEPNKEIIKQIQLKEIISKLKPGIYYVVAENAADSKKHEYQRIRAAQRLFITDMALTTFNGADGLNISVNSLQTAKPLPDIKLQLIAKNNKILASTKTNSEGWASFAPELLNGKGGNSPEYVFANGNGFVLQKLNVPAFDLSDRGADGKKITGKIDAFLYLERNIYRPGETIILNALLRDKDAKALSKQPVVLKVQRPDGKILIEHNITGDENGFYRYTIPLSKSALTGLWRIQMYADSEQEIGNTTFTVEDFVPSRLTLDLKHSANNVELFARYLFGAKASNLMADAHVVFRHRDIPKYEQYKFGLLNDGFTSLREEIPLETLDELGKAKFPLPKPDKINTSLPLQATVYAEAFDVSGRAIKSSLNVPLFLRSNMIGLKGNDASDIEVIVLDNNEKPSKANLKAKLYFEEMYYDWAYKDYRWHYTAMYDDQLIREFDIQVDGLQKIDLKPEKDGFYRLELYDENSGAASSKRFSKGYISKTNEVPDELTVITDKKQYKSGEIAKITIKSPFAGHGIFLIANDKIIKKQNIILDPKGTTLEVKVQNNWGVGAYALVTGFRPLESPEKHLPKRAIGLNWLALDKQDNIIEMQINAPETVRPRQEIEIPIVFKGAKDNVMFTFAAIDEGILALTGFKTADPVAHFFAKHVLDLEIRDMYDKIIDPMAGEKGILKTGGDMAYLEKNMAALSKRSFKIVSLHSGPLKVDTNGKAFVKIKLPDFNGTLRLMALAYNKNAIGSHSSQMMVRDPILLEASLPRFIAPNDQAIAHVSLHNSMKKEETIHLDVKAEGSIAVLNTQEFKFKIDPDHKFDQKIMLKGLKEGDGKLILTVTGKKIESHQKIIKISCRSETPKIRQQKIYHLSRNGESIIHNKDDLMLTINAKTPWNMQAIAKNLVEYPYGCIEQTLSRMMGSLYLKQNVNKGLVLLSDKQLVSGGFAFFSGDSDPWISAYAYDVLSQIESTPKLMLQSLEDFLINYVSNGDNNDLDSKSYALYLLAKNQKIESAKVRYFYETNKSLSKLGKAFTMGALLQINDLKRFALDKIKIEQSHDSIMRSEIRDQAAITSVFMENAKINDKVAQMAYENMKKLEQMYAQNNGQLSTQEQAWLLRAGIRQQSDKDANCTINDKVYEIKNYLNLKNLKDKELHIKNVGSEPIWINATTLHDVKTAEQGISIKRSYYDLDGKEVKIEHLKQGMRLVAVLKIKLKTPEMRYLLIKDLLPAGFELEPLTNTNDKKFPWHNPSPVLLQQNKDDKFIAMLQTNDTAKLAYRIQVTTLGKFTNPGSFVEDMYSPNIFAYGNNQKINIS